MTRVRWEALRLSACRRPWWCCRGIAAPMLATRRPLLMGRLFLTSAPGAQPLGWPSLGAGWVASLSRVTLAACWLFRSICLVGWVLLRLCSWASVALCSADVTTVQGSALSCRQSLAAAGSSGLGPRGRHISAAQVAPRWSRCTMQLAALAAD